MKKKIALTLYKKHIITKSKKNDKIKYKIKTQKKKLNN